MGRIKQDKLVEVKKGALWKVKRISNLHDWQNFRFKLWFHVPLPKHSQNTVAPSTLSLQVLLWNQHSFNLQLELYHWEEKHLTWATARCSIMDKGGDRCLIRECDFAYEMQIFSISSWCSEAEENSTGKAWVHNPKTLTEITIHSLQTRPNNLSFSPPQLCRAGAKRR